MTFIKRDLATRFWVKVDRTGQCWPWDAWRDRKGYGRFKIDGKRQLAHRVSWELFFGPIANGLCVLHQCDNPCCVRPSHLFLGTRGDNNRDCVAKGRERPWNRVITHCKHGHEFTPANTRLAKTGNRQCRACHQAYSRECRRRERRRRNGEAVV